MTDLRMLILGAKMIGLRNALRAVQNAWQRNRLDTRYRRDPPGDWLRQPGRLVEARTLPDGAAHGECSGALFRFESAVLIVRCLADDLLVLGWDGAGSQPSYAVVDAKWPAGSARLSSSGPGWQLATASLILEIGDGGSVELQSKHGLRLRRDGPPSRTGYGWRQISWLPPEGSLYGLGERAGRLNLRPGAYRFWNRDAGGSYGPGSDPLYICMPLYVCLGDHGSYLAFYDNTFDGRLVLGDAAELTFSGGPARYYLTVGSPDVLLARLASLTGRAPLPPRWALGFQQSRWGYGSEAELRRVREGFRQHDLPLSALVMDADHMLGYRTLSTDLARYPTLVAFADELHEEGVHLVASVNPGAKCEPGFGPFDEGVREDVFCKTPAGHLMRGVVWPGWAAFPDFTDARVRGWWGRQYGSHLADGIDGFWHDMNEPASFVAWGEPTFPLSTRHSLDGRGGDHREAHNLYGRLMDQAAFEGLRLLRPEKRPWILSRSGWVGMQRHAWTWTGDVETSWAALRQTVPCVLGLGLSGQPYSGPDVGGFSGAPSPELFVRWFQLSSFLPFFRTHCAFYLPRREPWVWGEELLPILRSQLRLRQSLMPYWYTLAWQTSQTGWPLVRPLFWDEPHNRHLWEVDDAFLVGSQLLVAPILDKGIESRKVRLPSGQWYRLADDRPLRGGQVVDLQAPLEQLPVLVRAGTVLPREVDGALELHVYRPGPGRCQFSQLYSDAGDGYGVSRLDRFWLQPARDGVELRWTSEGEYNWPYPETVLHLHGFGSHQVTIDGRRVILAGGRCPVKPGQTVTTAPE